MNLRTTLFAILTFLANITFAQPANDEPCNAIEISVENTCNFQTYTNTLATASAGITAPGCAGYSGGDVWFSFVMPNYGYHTLLEMSALDFTTGGMAVYSGTDCSNLTLVACNDGGTGMPALTVEDGCTFADAGAIFWVRVWENGNDNNGNFELCATAVAPNLLPGISACGTNLIAGNACCDAILLGEELDGYCGNTNGYTDEPDEILSFCAFIDNNAWLAFVASDETVEIGIEFFNCDDNNGIQVAIMETVDCNNFTVLSNCWNPGPNSVTMGTLTANGMTAGETYYIMVDGWGGDFCDYSLSIISGVETVSVSADDEEICDGQSTQLHVNVIGSGNYSYAWSPAASLDDPTSSDPIASPNITTNYTVTVTGVSNDVHTLEITVFPAAPSQPSITGLNSVCQNTSGTVYYATASNTTSYTWSTTGSATIVGSNTLDSVVIDWGTSGGDICLMAGNNCGFSPSECLTVTTSVQPILSANNPPVACMPEGLDLTTVAISNAANGGGPVTYHPTQNDADAGTNFIIPPVVYTTGTYFIRMETGPNCYDVTSIDVTVENPSIVVVNPARKCSPETIDLSTVVVSEVNGFSGGTRTYFSDSLEAVNVVNEITNTDISVAGTYWVRYTTPNGCFVIAPIEVIIDITPDLTVVQPAPLCPGGSLDLNNVVLIDANGATFTKLFYTSNALAGLGIPALALSNTVVSNSQSYFLRAVTPNDCAQIVEIIVTTGVTPAGNITGGGTVCPGDDISLTFNLTGGGPFDVVYNDGTSNISLNSIADGHAELISITNNTTFTLVSIADGNGCNGNINGATVSASVNTAPTATISGSTDICGSGMVDLTFALTGTGPFTVVYTDDLNNQTTLSSISNGHVESVLVTADVTYTLVSVTDNSGCSGTVSGNAIITLTTPLSISNVSETCTAAFTDYSISFEVNGGDPSSYIVGGGTGSFSGNVFTSDLIGSGMMYSFSVSDNSVCPTQVVSGSVNCLCATDAGNMDLAGIEVCANETATATLLAGTSNLSPGDVLQYVIHDTPGASLGTVFGLSDTPEFGLLSGMQTGVIYYISAIAGPDDGAGDVDQSHLCLSVAAGTEVIFYELPVGTISGTNSICLGASTDLTFNFTTGFPPFDVVYTDGTNNFTLQNIPDGHTETVTPNTTTTFVLVSITDNTSAACQSMGTGSAVITVNEAPSFTDLNLECNSTNTEFRVTFQITGGDPSSYAVTGDAGNLDNGTNIFTSVWMTSGASYSFSIDDGNSCGPAFVSGTYACDCTTNAGAMESTILQVCEDETAIAQHLTTNLILDGDDMLGFVLHTGSGNTLGTIIATQSIPEFAYNISINYGETYYISAIAGNDDGSGFPVLDNSIDPCLSITAGQPVVFTQTPFASLTGDNTICAGDSTDLTFNLTGSGSFDLTYTDGVSNFQLGAILDGHQVKIFPGTSTTYTLVSINQASTPSCQGTIDPMANTVQVDVLELPSVNNFSASCNAEGTEFIVTFQLTQGNAANYTVTGDLGTLTGNTFTSEWMTSGLSYHFEITDGSGCPPIIVSGTEYCNCTPDILPEISIVDEVSCFGEEDASLNVVNQNGVAPFSFVWNNGTTGETIDELASGWHYVTMTDANNCESVDSIFLDQPTAIEATMIAEQHPKCYGDQNGIIAFTDVSGGAGEYVYSIDGDRFFSENAIHNLSGGNYEGTIADASGCEWNGSLLLIEPGEFTVDLGEDLRIQLGDSVQLKPIANAALDTFHWSEAPLPCQDCWEQVIYPTNSIAYSLDAVNENGCKASDRIVIWVDKDRPVYIPTAFSPNGDGDNDEFMVYAGEGVEEITVFRIFNRWGALVHEKTNLPPKMESSGWDGRLNGEELQAGVFIYFVEILFSDGTTEIIRGDVTLLR